MTVASMHVEAEKRLTTVRLVGLCFALAFGLISASGLSARMFFTQPNTLKYAVTVAVAVYLIIVIASPKPLLMMTATTVAVAPFASTATVGGVRLTLGMAALAPALVLHLASRPAIWQSVNVQRSSLALAVPGVGIALAIALLHSSAPVEPMLTMLAAIGTGWLVAVSARDGASRRWIVGAAVASATINAGLALWELVSGRPLDLYNNAAVYTNDYFYHYGSAAAGFVIRPSGGLSDPNSLGNVLAVACPLVLALVLSLRRRGTRALAMLAGVVILVSLASTLSRMSWVAAAVGLVIASVLLPRRKMMQAALIVVISSLPAIAIALSLGGGSLSDRAATVLDPTAATTAGRQEDLTRVALWKAAVEVAGDHPFLGVGLGDLPPYLIASVPDASDASHAHSTYLNLLAEAGVLGLGGLLFVMFAAGKDCVRGLRTDRTLFAGSAGTLVAMATVWTTDYTIRFAPVAMAFATIVGLVAASRRSVSR